MELRPLEGVASDAGRLVATSAEPWLTIDGRDVSGLAGRFVEIVYRASFWDEPARPVFRFRMCDGAYVDRIAAGPIAGAGIWIGRVPSGTRRLEVSPTNRIGAFGFRIEHIRALPWLTVVALGLRRQPRRVRSALLTLLIGWLAESDVNLAWAIGAIPFRTFESWRADLAGPREDERLDAPRFDWRAMSPVRVLIGDGDPAARQRTLDSLAAQNFANWTLVPDDPPVAADGLTCWLGPGDVLSPIAFACVAEQAHRHPACRLFYADAIRIEGGRATPWFQPGWSPRLHAARPLGDTLIFVRDLQTWPNEAQQLFRRQGQVSPSVLSRLAASEVRPLRRLLIEIARRGSLSDSCETSDPLMVRSAANASRTTRAPGGEIGRPPLGSRRRYAAPHHEATGTQPIVLMGSIEVTTSNTPVRASVIIPTRDHPALLRRCVASIRAHAGTSGAQIVIVDNCSVTAPAKRLLAALAGAPDTIVLTHPQPFNFSAMCNAAAAAAGGDILVFLNDDTEVLTSDWLDRLAAHAADPSTGAVGAKLVYSDGRLQHVGIVVGLGESAGHFGAFAEASDLGWAGRNATLHEVSAVTGACLAVERSKFWAVGGFDEKHLPVELGDVDLCLKLNERGWQTVVDPGVTILHEESASRGGATFRRLDVHASERAVFAERWRHVLRDDPFFHPGLSLYSFAPALA